MKYFLADKGYDDSELLKKLESKEHLLKYIGYDKETDSLRYTFKYPKEGNKIFRIKRKEDIRIFPKIARTSKKYKRIYNE